MRRVLLALIATLPLATVAAAGIQPGTYASERDLAAMTFLDSTDPATTHGTYSSAVHGTTANLSWQPNAVSFAGACSGSATLIARSQGVCIVTLAQASTMSIDWSMNQVVRVGNQVGWALVDTQTGDAVQGLSYDGTTALASGATPTLPTGSQVAMVPAGQYWLVMLTECTATGGALSLSASFSTIPTGPILQVSAHPTVAVGTTFDATVDIAGMAANAVGAQARISYDPAVLAFVGLSGGAAFPAVIYQSASPGSVTFATGVSGGGAGAGVTAGNVATLTFRAIAPACGDDALALAPTGFPTRITGAGGTSLPFAIASDVAVTALGTLSLTGVPAGASGLPADAGVRSATVPSITNASVTATDTCGNPVGVALAVTLPDGSSAASIPATFPIGTTTIGWTAADRAGNVATATRAVQVDDRQLFTIHATLAGTILGASTRSTQLTHAGGAPTGILVAIPMPGASGSALASISPALVGTPACAGLKDRMHSLRDTAPVTIAGNAYSASFTLVQGDSNDDDVVDILDFGVFVGQYRATGAATDGLSNFNGDAAVNNADFTFISANFLRAGEACAAWSGGQPRQRIGVRELRRLGLGELAGADLNLDGWLDAQDMAAWLQGVRPGGNPEAKAPVHALN